MIRIFGAVVLLFTPSRGEGLAFLPKHEVCGASPRSSLGDIKPLQFTGITYYCIF
jgi:hypothetical protein